MVNIPSLRSLRTFLLLAAHEAHHLLSMPALYNVYTSCSPFDGFMDVLRWIEETASLTVNALVLEPALKAPSGGIAEGNWIEVRMYLPTFKFYDSRSVDRVSL